MESRKPNKQGVYIYPEKISVPMPGSYKCQLTIEIALCEDGKYRYGRNYKCGESGGGHGVSKTFSPAFDSKAAAIIACADKLIEDVTQARLKAAHLKKIIAQIEDFKRGFEAKKSKPFGKKGFVFGWKYGGNGYQLYIQIYPAKMKPEDKPAGMAKCVWGVTAKLEEAHRFKDMDDCLAFYRSRHQWPEDYEVNIWNGKVQFFQVTDTGIHQVMPVEQPSLF
jgi:hypothetical protein